MFVVHPEARVELAVAAARYERERPGLGVEFAAMVYEGFDAIEANPRAWPPWHGRGPSQLNIRRYVVPRFPYTLPFVLREEMVGVLAVAHVKRAPGYWLRRLATLP